MLIKLTENENIVWQWVKNFIISIIIMKWFSLWELVVWFWRIFEFLESITLFRRAAHYREFKTTLGIIFSRPKTLLISAFWEVSEHCKVSPKRVHLKTDTLFQRANGESFISHTVSQTKRLFQHRHEPSIYFPTLFFASLESSLPNRWHSSHSPHFAETIK